MKTNTNKSKTIILAGLSCLTVTLGALVTTRNMNNFKLVSSDTSRNKTLNASTMAFNESYRKSSQNTGYVVYYNAFFNLDVPGNYIALWDYSFSNGTFGGDHLFYKQITKTGRYNLDLCIGSLTGCYYDQALSREIYVPGIGNLTKIVMTLSSENTFPFNESYFTAEGYSVSISEDELAYTITGNLSSPYNRLTLMGAIAKEEDLNKKIVVDQIYLEYNCGN